jgi:hypothetical protein
MPWSLDPDTRLRVSTEYAHALRAAEQWTDLADTLEELMPTIDRIENAELASGLRLELLEARWNAGRISASIVDDLIDECSTGSAHASDKLRAAAAAITISDNLCCTGTAPRVEQFARALVHQNANDLLSKDYELVYHCSHGDLDTAVEVAASLVAAMREEGNEPLLCRYLMRAAHVFEVGDRVDESLTFAREAFAIAERFALCNSACHAARRLGWAYLDRLATEEVSLWTQKGEHWAKRTQHPASIADLSMLRAEVALAGGCVADAESLFEMSQRLWGPLKHPRAEAHALALRVALSVEKGSGVNATDASEAWRLFHLLANKPMLDLVIGRFVLGFAASGRRDDSRTMLEDYLTKFRRERGAVRPVFRALVARARVEYGLAYPDDTHHGAAEVERALSANRSP